MEMSQTPNPTCRNAMEPLVTEEVENQLRQLSTRKAQYINLMDVVAYALNRLPPLYATSEEGWRSQQRRAKQELEKEIKIAVRRGLAAVERDPLRGTSRPSLSFDLAPQVALEKLRRLLQRSDLTWQNLADVIEQSLQRASQGEMFWRQRTQAPKSVNPDRRHL